MKLLFIPFAFLLFVSSTALLAAESSSDLVTPLAFINKHCADCHNDSTSEGGFRADLLSKDLADAANYKGWSRVLARVQSGEMPPQDAERPAEADVSAALTALKTVFHVDAQARHGEAGRVRVRRLNRLEYENTVRELLGIDTPLRDLLPEDDLRDGFSNQAGGLSISPIHIQQYMAAADRALEAASVRQAQPETTTHRFSYTHDAEKPFHGHAHNKLQCDRSTRHDRRRGSHLQRVARGRRQAARVARALRREAPS
jgi:mono/diheme cytochrome c family protein